MHINKLTFTSENKSIAWLFRYFTVILFVFFPLPVLAQQNLKFRHLNSEDGLSQNHVNAIFKDHKGFMWFATDDGLNKYDGYRFYTYKHDTEKTASLCNSIVYDMLEDELGNMWVGTANGLDQFNRDKDTFIHHSPAGEAILINDILIDRKKRMWLATTRGLYLFNKLNGMFKYYLYTEKDINIVNSNFIYEIAEDDEGEDAPGKDDQKDDEAEIRHASIRH